MNKYEKMDLEKVLAKDYSSRELEIIDLYRKVIDCFVMFCNDLRAKNVSDIFNVFSILAHNGYLSFDCDIQIGSKDGFDIFQHEGADLLVGTGNCLNFSDFLKDIYNKMDNKAYVVANYLYGVKDSSFSQVDRLIQRILMFNHACCLVVEENVPCIFDPLNVEAYLYSNDKYQYGNHGGKLRINFDKTYLLNDITLDQFNTIKTYPKLYNSIGNEKRQSLEKSLGKINPVLFEKLDQTNCMERFHEVIKPYLVKAKKIQKY